MQNFGGFQRVLKLSDHGTYRAYAPMQHQESAYDDDPMNGDYERPTFRRPTPGNRGLVIYTSGGNSIRLNFLQGMPIYANKSMDELRYEDYLLNRNGCAGPKAGISNKSEYKIPQNPGEPLFPFPSNYGKSPSIWNNFLPPSSGQAPPFAQGNGGSIFGSVNTNSPTPFAPQTNTLFGSAVSQNQGGLFGQGTSPSTGIFGTPSWATAGTGNVLGSSTSAQPSTGTFGSTPTTQSWLNPNQSQQAPIQFQLQNTIQPLNWSTANKFQIGSFGTPATSSPFAPAATQQNTSNIFGATQQPTSIFAASPAPQPVSIFGTASPAPQSGSIFGTRTPGVPQAGGYFGNQNPAPANTNSFGSTSAAQSSLFPMPPTQPPAQPFQPFNSVFPNSNFYPQPQQTFPAFNNQGWHTNANPQFLTCPQTQANNTNVKISSQSYGDLPPLTNEQADKYLKKSESFSVAGKDYEKILEKAKVRSYSRVPYLQDNVIQSWIQRYLFGWGKTRGSSGDGESLQTRPSSEKSDIILSPKKVLLKKFYHWTDPDLYTPPQPKSEMDTDETFQLKTSRWKTLRLVNEGLKYDRSAIRSFMAPSKTQAGIPTIYTRNNNVEMGVNPRQNNTLNAVRAGEGEPRIASNSKILTDVGGPSVCTGTGTGDQAPATPTVILTKDKYYCNPSTVDLARRTDSKGICPVENFEVGHVEWGKIVFLGTMDVGGLNLDKSIVFRHKELIINPEDEEAPKLGTGLNRPAVITLEKVLPLDPRTQKLQRFMCSESAKKYEDYLRSVCDNMGYKFLTYESLIGRWTFQIDHFVKNAPVTDQTS